MLKEFKMKKIMVVLLALALFGGFASAQEEDEGIGLDAGIEFGLGDVADKVVFGLAPQISYESSFLDGALDVFAEGIYGFAFDDEVGQEASLEEELGYNLSLGEASTLSIIVNNYNEFIIAPKVDSNLANAVNGAFTPSLKFTQSPDFGDIYGQVGLPIEYAFFEKELDVTSAKWSNQDTGLGLDLTAGIAAGFGLGVEITAHIALKPESDYAGLDLILSYENGSIYGEVEIDTGNEFKDISIIPEFDYSFGAVTVWINAEIGNINASEDALGVKPGVSFAPAIGVKYSF
jgi:hypothetical protein